LKLLLLLLAVVPAFAAPMYTITGLGGVGGSLSEAFAISTSGAVAGTAFDTNGDSHGFVQQNASTFYESGTDIRGVNSTGMAVGRRADQATIWRDGVGSAIGDLGGGESWALGISDAGYATGAALRTQGDLHGFLWFNGRMVDIGTLGGNWSSGYAVNNAGQVAGVSSTARGTQTAFLWDAEKGMRQLRGPKGYTDTRAFGLNDAGQVVGLSMTSSRNYHATLWDTTGAVIDLGTLGGGHSFAYSINDSGSVVGYSEDALGRTRAFLWSDGMLFDLNSLLDASGWLLTAAYGINDSGQIVGSGYYNGVSSAFLLNPVAKPAFSQNSALLSSDALTPSEVPEPATIVPAMLALAVIVWKYKGSTTLN
jgi:probable HAF family extracellular repeat protein